MKTTEQGKVSRFRIPIMIGFFSLSSLFLLGMASAAPFQDIPQALQDAVFGGGDPYMAKMLLSVAILASLGLTLSMSKVNFVGTMIVLLATAGLLSAIGWLDYWIILFACLIIAGMFAKNISNWIAGSGDSGG